MYVRRGMERVTANLALRGFSHACVQELDNIGSRSVCSARQGHDAAAERYSTAGPVPAPGGVRLTPAITAGDLHIDALSLGVASPADEARRVRYALESSNL